MDIVPNPNPQPTSPQEEPQITEPVQQGPLSWHAILLRIAAVLFVIAGLVVGFGGGFAVSFGSCYKSSCSPVESGAPFWIPVATLFITVPIARKAFRKK